jgi:hypothetical protein
VYFSRGYIYIVVTTRVSKLKFQKPKRNPVENRNCHNQSKTYFSKRREGKEFEDLRVMEATSQRASGPKR